MEAEAVDAPESSSWPRMLCLRLHIRVKLLVS